MNYASVTPNFVVDHCGIDENGPWIILLLAGNIPMYYKYIKCQWQDYHIPPTVLTEKTNVSISKIIEKDYSDYYIFISKYSVTKFLLTKNLFVQNYLPPELLSYMIGISD